MKDTIYVYSKQCLGCTRPLWNQTRNRLINEGFIVKERRTVYNPIWHKIATAKYGNEDYPPFALIEGCIVHVSELEGRKVENETEKVPEVPARTTKKSTRKGSVARKKTQAKKEA